MRQGWRHFIHQALEGVADDPHVRMLRERLRSGGQVIRVHFEDSGQGPSYRVVLSLDRQLSELRVPHSESFTRWSLEAGVRMATLEDEVARFTLLLRERLQAVEAELGRSSLQGVLVEVVRELGPPKAQASLSGRQVHSLSEGRARLQAMRTVEGVITTLVKDLGTGLKYDEAQVAGTLDAVLERFVSAPATHQP